MAISSISPATCTSTPAAARIIRAQPTRAILLAKATAAMSVLNSKRAKQDPWLVKLLADKERKVAAVAVANKMARVGWALMMRQEDFRATSTAA